MWARLLLEQITASFALGFARVNGAFDDEVGVALTGCNSGKILSPEFNELLSLFQPVQHVRPQHLKPRQQCLV